MMELADGFQLHIRCFDEVLNIFETHTLGTHESKLYWYFPVKTQEKV